MTNPTGSASDHVTIPATASYQVAEMPAKDFKTLLQIWDLIKKDQADIHSNAENLTGTNCKITGSAQGYDFNCGDPT